MKNKPNLFVVGAAKAGSTSLYHILNSQESIFMSPIKEVHYFSNDIDISKFSKDYIETIVLDVESLIKKRQYSRAF